MAQLVTADGGVYEVNTELLVDALGSIDNITFPVTVSVTLSAPGKIVSL